MFYFAVIIYILVMNREYVNTMITLDTIWKVLHLHGDISPSYNFQNKFN